MHLDILIDAPNTRRVEGGEILSTLILGCISNFFNACSTLSGIIPVSVTRNLFSVIFSSLTEVLK